MDNSDRNRSSAPASPAGARGKAVGAYARRGLHAQVEVPVNLERVLLMAVEDETFRAALLADAERALTDFRMTLEPSEKGALLSMSRSVLEAAIVGLKPNRQIGRMFAKQVAAAVAGTLLLGASSYCCGGVDGDEGYMPDGGTDGRPDGHGDEGDGNSGTDSGAGHDG
jgi:hypothetical protein